MVGLIKVLERVMGFFHIVEIDLLVHLAIEISEFLSH